MAKENASAKIGIETGKFGGGINKEAVIAKRPDDTKTALKRLSKDLISNKNTVIVAMIMVVFATLCSIAAPRLIGLSLDKYLSEGFAGKLILCLSLLFVAYVFEGLFTWGQSSLMHKVSQTVVSSLRNKAFAKIGKLPVAYMDQHSHGELTSRIINDVDSVSTALSTGISQLLQSLITVVVTMVVMLSLSPVLTVAGLILLPVRAFIIKRVLKHSKKAFSARQKSLGVLNGFAEESISGRASIKAYGCEDRTFEKFKKLNDDLRVTGEKAEWMAGMTGSIAGCLTNTSYALVAIVGCLMILSGKNVSLGIISSMLIYTKQCSRPLNEIANQFNLLMAALAGAERVYAFLDEPETENGEGKKTESIDAVEIKFENVGFGYIEGKQVLKGVNLTIPAGSTFALVGETGCGKTTMMNLIERFYDPDEGSILFNGISSTELSKTFLRSQVGIVLQDPYLFSGTIKENILLGKPNATGEEIEAAAKMANADDFIKRLSHGYDTKIKDGAASLSHGQRQMIAIARVFLKNPAVLILDEATSSIDIYTERKIREALKLLMKNRTSIVIAHRQDTIKNADAIAVIANGTIVETGTHSELINRDGIYRKLFRG